MILATLALSALISIFGYALPLQSYHGTLPADFDMEQVVLNIAPLSVVQEKCTEWGMFGPLYSGCSCILDDGETHDDQGGPCTVPAGKLCEVWVIDSPAMIEHELAHCVAGRWH